MAAGATRPYGRGVAVAWPPALAVAKGEWPWVSGHGRGTGHLCVQPDLLRRDCGWPRELGGRAAFNTPGTRVQRQPDADECVDHLAQWARLQLGAVAVGTQHLLAGGDSNGIILRTLASGPLLGGSHRGVSTRVGFRGRGHGVG